MPVTLTGAVAVVTGGASGIGAALARRFAVEGARVVVVADRDAAAAEALAGQLSCPVPLGLELDVTDEPRVAAAAESIEREHGPIDLWCSNAGLAGAAGLGSDQDWARAWSVHLLAHLYAARHVLPR